MKLYKLFFLLLSLLFIFQANPKIYICKEGGETASVNVPNVFDVCILLIRSYAPKEWRDSEVEPVTKSLIDIINDKEAVIANRMLMRSLWNEYQSSKSMFFSEKYDDFFAALLEGWLLFQTGDGRFYLLIPKEKYPEIKNNEDLEKIGIAKLMPVFHKKPTVEKLGKDLLKRVWEQDAGKINITPLLRMFSTSEQAKKVVKRVFLSGHEKTLEKSKTPMEAKKNQDDALVAGLTVDQYGTLLQKLKEVNCSCLLVSSSYAGGWNAFASQTMYEKQQQSMNAFEDEAELPFIVVAGSLPDSAMATKKFEISNLFLDLHLFFKQETKEMFSLIKEGLNLEKERLLSKKMLSVSTEAKNKLRVEKVEETLKKVKKVEEGTDEIAVVTGQAWENIFGEKISLVERKPWVVLTFFPILQNISYQMVIAQPSMKFPGRPLFRFSEDFISGDKVVSYPFLMNHQIKYGKKEPVKINNLERIKQNITYRLKNIEQKAIETMREGEKLVKQGRKFRSRKLIKKGEMLVKQGQESLKKQKKELQQAEQNAQELMVENLFIYPSVISVPFEITMQEIEQPGQDDAQYETPDIISMIPGKAHHYFKEITVKTIPAKKEKDFDQIKKEFLVSFGDTDQLPTTLFFIETLKFKMKSKEVVFKNVIVRHRGFFNEDGPYLTFDFVYQDQVDKKYYYAFFNSTKDIDDMVFRSLPGAKKGDIMEWILETAPSKEALAEATSGIETEEKFRSALPIKEIEHLSGIALHDFSLLQALENGDVQAAKDAIESGANLDVKDEDGKAVLELAWEQGTDSPIYAYIVELLVSSGKKPKKELDKEVKVMEEKRKEAILSALDDVKF